VIKIIHKEDQSCPRCGKPSLHTYEAAEVNEIPVVVIKDVCDACDYYRKTIMVDGQVYINRDEAARMVSERIMNAD